MSSQFDVIIDTREKHPWLLYSTSIAEITHGALKTGDYAICGLEDVLCIERKSSVVEIANNITQKRFEKELERMTEYPHVYIICEFDAKDVFQFPLGTSLPPRVRKKLRISGKFLLKRLSEIQMMGIQVIFAGSPQIAAYMATNIMKRVYEQYQHTIQVEEQQV